MVQNHIFRILLRMLPVTHFAMNQMGMAIGYDDISNLKYQYTVSKFATMQPFFQV